MWEKPLNFWIFTNKTQQNLYAIHITLMKPKWRILRKKSSSRGDHEPSDHSMSPNRSFLELFVFWLKTFVEELATESEVLEQLLCVLSQSVWKISHRCNRGFHHALVPVREKNDKTFWELNLRRFDEIGIQNNRTHVDK